MFKRLRTLKISLAAKCQLLFGLAVVLIIGAALFVPWQRMEQLTEQLNERSARTLVDYTTDAHIASVTNAPAPTTRPLRATPLALPPTTMPLRADDLTTPPRLILVQLGTDDSDLTLFERRAIRHLADQRDRDFYTQLHESDDGSKQYRYARFDTRCAKCHTAPATTSSPAEIPIAQSSAADIPNPTTQPAAHLAGRTAHSKILGLVAVEIPSQIETGQLLLNRVFILSAGMLAGTLAIIVFYLITTRLILQPVRVLQETAEKVSEGDLNIRSDISTGDEFQQLSETFNTMLTNLKQSADQLRAVNKSLDIKLGQLAESNVALYESNRLKSEFLANVSHELRTPLNSILGFADLLKDSSALSSDAKNTRYLQNILGSGKNLLELINDLLDLAKIEAGRMEIRSEPLSLGDLFEGLSSVLKPLSEQKNLTIRINVAADVPIIQTDPAKLQQVLYNLMSNAIKFSPPGESIDLAAERDTTNGDTTEGVRISVTDRGPGVPAAKHQLIFEKFRQVDASVTRTHSGTGLGLAISKELASLLGGSIGITSEEGKGSTFWIVLPMKNEAGVQDLRGKLVLS